MLATLALIVVAATAADAPLYESEFIFTPNDKHNHGSSIVEAADGTLVTAWFHGSGERTCDDVMVQGARRHPGGPWCEPFVMADTPDLPDCNPVLFIDPRGTLWLIWIAVQDNQWGGSLLKYRLSDDYLGDGAPKWRWQDVIHARPVDLEPRFVKLVDAGLEVLGPILDGVPELAGFKKEALEAKAKAGDKLYQRLGWMTRLHPIMVGENRMLLGLYSDVFNCSLAAWTENYGETWSFSTPILDPELRNISNIQPSFVQRKNGEIAAFMRDNGLPKKVRTATSKDLGATWSDVGTLSIDNPGSSVEAISLKSGRWAMVCNDTSDGRNRLTVFLSEDEGLTWPKFRRLENESGKDDGSFSYPSVIQAKDGSIHATYSHTKKDVKGSTIKHVRFNEEWILEGDPVK